MTIQKRANFCWWWLKEYESVSVCFLCVCANKNKSTVSPIKGWTNSTKVRHLPHQGVWQSHFGMLAPVVRMNDCNVGSELLLLLLLLNSLWFPGMRINHKFALECNARKGCTMYKIRLEWGKYKNNCKHSWVDKQRNMQSTKFDKPTMS